MYTVLANPKPFQVCRILTCVTFLQVMAMIRWNKWMKETGHKQTKRMPYFDDITFTIPKVCKPSAVFSWFRQRAVAMI